MTSEQPPQIYQYSVKLETTQKAINVTVHVYADNPTTARNEAVELLISTREKLESEGLKPAPIGIEESK